MGYVIMKDNFLSGWGPAEGKINLYEVECDTIDQLDMIERNAGERSDMSDIRVKDNETEETGNLLISRVHFDDIGGVWKREE